MINFLTRKIWRNRWLMLCLLLGNILLIGITAGTPLYITATMQRIFQQDLRAIGHNHNTFPAVANLRFTMNSVSQDNRLSTYEHIRDYWWPEDLGMLGISTQEQIVTYTMLGWDVTPVVPREETPSWRQVSFSAVHGIENHIHLFHGRMPSDTLVDGNIIEVIATTAAIQDRDLLYGELLRVDTLPVEGGAAVRPRDLYVKVVGVFEIPDNAGEFWSIPPIFWNSLITSATLIQNEFLANYQAGYRMQITWSNILDHTEMAFMDVDHYQLVINRLMEQYNDAGIMFFTHNFHRIFQLDQVRTERLAVTLWILQVPIFIMLALFVYMVSKQILALDKNDISVLKSRGASRKQVLGIYAMQGLFMGLASLPIGYLLGILLCQTLGASNGFLDLVQRESLRIFITLESILYALGAALFSFMCMFLPVIRFSKFGIVEQKRSRTGKVLKPVWMRYFLDILCLGLSILLLVQFNRQQEMLAELNSAIVPGVDPLLYLSSSLFILGSGMLFLRIFPYLIKLIFTVGKRYWNPSMYASLLKVIRSIGEEQFIMLFLIFTLSIGLFSAQAARTINLNNEHQIRYLGGADIRFQEFWMNNMPDEMTGGDLTQLPDTIVFMEPDFERYTNFEEVDAITRVMNRAGRFQGRGINISNNLNIMAIETNTFGETIWFRDDLSRIHINYYLNALAMRADGVILSENFKNLGIQLGDVVTLHDQNDGVRPPEGRFTVVGFVSHWPGFAPVTRRLTPAREIIEETQSLAVVNFGHMSSQWGIRPYEIWMRTNTESNAFLHQFIAEEEIITLRMNDTRSQLVEIRQDPIVQGTNGVLTVSFIVILLVCFTGFLIYLILSIKSRVLQFGIFRAMGMSMRGILGILLSEQGFITIISIGVGILIGEITANLFVPLIQISYTAAEQAIPLLVVIEQRDYTNIFTVLSVMIVICMAALGFFISRMNITQALKLGED